MMSVNKVLTWDAAFERKVTTVIEAVDVVTIEPVVAYLHPGAERAHGRKILDCETDGLRRCSETTITERLARAAFALRHEQFGRRAVIELHRFAFAVTRRDW